MVRVCILINVTFPWSVRQKLPPAIYDKLQNKIVVREADIKHNHRTGSDVVQHYPSSRRLKKVEQQEVEEIIGLKPNNKHVQD